jgi:hypothetical protein
MGLDSASAMLLCAAKMVNADFSSVAMIGRQALFPDHRTLRRVFDVLGIDRDARQFLRQHQYSEEFLTLLGANHIDSVDVSPYQGATILHDMNQPIPPELCERFTVVHDGGTIEHVFNIPQALKNCMEMVRVGGHFTQVNITNNYCGHGFWQISPELIFRAFSPKNGYQVEAVLMHEVVRGGAWYLVSDPDEIRARVQLCNSQPTYILTIAKRIAKAPIFQQPPQQSDYVRMWDDVLHGTQSQRETPRAKPATWRRYVPKPVKRAIRYAIPERGTRGFSQSSYRRVTEDDVLHGRLATRALPGS